MGWICVGKFEPFNERHANVKFLGRNKGNGMIPFDIYRRNAKRIWVQSSISNFSGLSLLILIAWKSNTVYFNFKLTLIQLVALSGSLTCSEVCGWSTASSLYICSSFMLSGWMLMLLQSVSFSTSKLGSISWAPSALGNSSVRPCVTL